MELFLRERKGRGLSRETQRDAVEDFFWGRTLNRVLLIPPDFTRYHSGAGYLTCCCYDLLKDRAEVDILPALGTHAPMTAQELDAMYPGIPHDRFLVHRWREDVVRLGEISGEEMSELSEGLWTEPVAVEINRRVVEGGYDLILSLGQVVPHEVVGMSNHAKNLFVGVGGASMINSSHMLGAVWGLERMMGRDHSPVRKLFDLALSRFLADYPVFFMLTVMSAGFHMHGLFIGDTRRVLEEAVKTSQQHNLDWLEKPVKRCVVYLDPAEYRSTWLGNKAIYRTRMAMADGGELLILAPGVEKFGEDAENDRLIRKYGYHGRVHTLSLLQTERELQANMGAAAHLIHGSSDGRFHICYAAGGLTRREVESVGFDWADCAELLRRYPPEQMKPGFQTMPDGEEVFYIANPALGLWTDKARFEGAAAKDGEGGISAGRPESSGE